MARTAQAFTAGILLIGALAGCLDAGHRTAGANGENAGLVVAQQYLAAEAGAAILAAGGNAVDAAAAVQWALTVVEPQFSGIGGGTFMLHYDAATGVITTLDGRETAPAAATPTMFEHALRDHTHDPSVMGYAVGVPGTVALFDEALARWGTMDFATTMAPAIALAANGWEVTPNFAGDIEAFRYRIESWPPAAELFLPGSVCIPTQAGFGLTTTEVARCTGGAPPGVGTLLKNPALAATFELLAANGPSAFYGGELADAIVATAAQRDGIIMTSDLASYEVVERTPSVSMWKGYEVVTMDMPSSALTMQHILAMLEGDDLAAWGAGSADTLHHLIEAMHLAYADRAAYMADEAFVPVPQAGLMHPEYVAGRRALIHPDRVSSAVRAGDPWVFEPGGRPSDAPDASTIVRDEGHHTSHFVVRDAAGNMVSVTTTIEHLFGTGLLVPGYGFFLNNELTDFDWNAGGANEPEPGKRPRSSMTPTIVLKDGEPVLALGSPGGSTIITSVLQVLLNVLEHGMPLNEAVAAPRIYSPTYPNVRWEDGIAAEVREDLAGRGHVFEQSASRLGSVQAMVLTADGTWEGVADPRRDGAAVTVPAV